MAVPTIPWISIATDLFESPKIKEILDMENGELIVLYWIKLLLFCGRENNGGVLTRGNGKPYSRKAAYFGRSVRGWGRRCHQWLNMCSVTMRRTWEAAGQMAYKRPFARTECIMQSTRGDGHETAITW